MTKEWVKISQSDIKKLQEKKEDDDRKHHIQKGAQKILRSIMLVEFAWCIKS